MLKYLKIKNFALIRSYNIEWGAGLNILSGETGAGKSIVLNALSFALGARSDKQNIRAGETELRVEIAFDDLKESTINALQDIGIDDVEALIIVRNLNIDGRSEIRINGSLVTQTMLRQVTGTLVDIYGQFDLYSLLNVKEHINIIDSLVGADIHPLKMELSKWIETKNNIDKALKEAYFDPEEKQKTLEYLEYQASEISTANLKPEEEINLQNEKQKMLSIEKIANALNNVIILADSGYSEGFLALMNNALKSLSAITHISDEYEEYYARLDSAILEIDDIVDSIKANMDSLSYNQNEFDAIQSRLETYSKLKQKYGGSIESVQNYYEQTINQIDIIKNNEEYIKKLLNEKQDVQSKINQVCQKLTYLRKQVASTLQQKIVLELADLRMKGAQFEVRITNGETTLNGADDVEFYFSANAGEPLRPLVKVISGGEMSRFMLAYKNVVAIKDEISTLVFDEIDAGISGDVGSKVGEKLSYIAKNNQVIVVSHLPQIVSMGDRNFVIKKYFEDSQTFTTVEHLNEDGVISELVRLSGLSGESAQNYARELRRITLTKKM